MTFRQRVTRPLSGLVYCFFAFQVCLPKTSLKGADQKTDIERIRDGANGGDAGAQFSLGKAYLEGNGIPQDVAKAAALFRQAAEQGDLRAQHNLGVMYVEGTGVA